MKLRTPLYKRDWFWVVALPTALIAVVFFLAAVINMAAAYLGVVL